MITCCFESGFDVSHSSSVTTPDCPSLSLPQSDESEFWFVLLFGDAFDCRSVAQRYDVNAVTIVDVVSLCYFF